MIEMKRPSKEDVDSIIFNDEIYNRISDDTCPPKEEFSYPYGMFEHLGYYVNNKIVGLANIENNGRFHFQVLKSHRRLARIFLKDCLMAFNRSLYCEIPKCFMSVINFAKNNGFKEIGIVDNKTFIKSNTDYSIVKLIFNIKNEFC